MTVDEKITRLQESAMQEARSKGNAIVEQHKKALTLSLSNIKQRHCTGRHKNQG